MDTLIRGLWWDDARFINHNDTLNIRTDFLMDRYGVDVTARDIEAEEELPIGYESVEGLRPNESFGRTWLA